MQIKMLTHSAGPDGHRKVGQVLEVPDEEGRMLVAGGYAEQLSISIESEQPVETATAPVVAAEKATKSRKSTPKSV